ncbi:MAG: hypothetical protein DME49_09375 [Verrucomicrobia bacterium]|nr:MAG: hypothetical protein DME49_09375 [Verrucomicrobiota bacterium]
MFFVRPELMALPYFMRTRPVVHPLLLAFGLLICAKDENFAAKPQPQNTKAAASPAASAPASSPARPTTKPVVDQTAQVIIFGYHRFVDNVRHPDTEITPAAFEAQMKELKDRGITVIGMQDLLAWKRGEKSVPPRCAIITLDDGWKSQYEVAWPILKKFGYTHTMFIYTEGVQGGHFGGGQAITWEQLAEMRDAGVDIQGHTATHQDLRKPYDKVGSKQLLEQRLGVRVNCFAVPYGFYNQHVKDVARNAGYEAMFTVYGQPITYNAPLDSLGRYLIEANKPKVFEDAVKMISTSSGGGGQPVAEVATTNLSTSPADGETVRTALPLIKANLSAIGPADPGSVQLRVSGLGLVPATYDPKTGTVAYQVTQKLREKTCTVILSVKSGGKKIEAHWTFGIDETGAAASKPLSPTPTPKK